MSLKKANKHTRFLLLCAAALLLLIRPVRAQVDQSAIRGTVEDPTGAVIPDAKVTLTNEDTGLSLQTATSASGTYSFSPIKIGTYTVSV